MPDDRTDDQNTGRPDDDTRPDDDAPGTDRADDQGGDGDGGDGGTDWKREARKWERLAKANADKARRLDEIEAANKTEAERLAAERDQYAERARKATERAVRAEVRAVASTLRFRDPADALRLVDVDELVDDDGEVDEDAVKTALRKIAKDKPYLIADDAPARSGGDMSGGGGKGSDPASMSVEDFRKARRKRRE